MMIRAGCVARLMVSRTLLGIQAWMRSKGWASRDVNRRIHAVGRLCEELQKICIGDLSARRFSSSLMCHAILYLYICHTRYTSGHDVCMHADRHLGQSHAVSSNPIHSPAPTASPLQEPRTDCGCRVPSHLAWGACMGNLHGLHGAASVPGTCFPSMLTSSLLQIYSSAYPPLWVASNRSGYRRV